MPQSRAQQQHKPVCPCTALQELVHQHSVFKLLGQASSRALQLLLRATDKEQNTPVLLWCFANVPMLLMAFVNTWKCCMAGHGAEEEEAAEKQLALQQLSGTGEEQTLQQLCLLRWLIACSCL